MLAQVAFGVVSEFARECFELAAHARRFVRRDAVPIARRLAVEAHLIIGIPAECMIQRPRYCVRRAMRKPSGSVAGSAWRTRSIESRSSGVTRSSASIQKIQSPVVWASANSCLSL